MQMMAQIVIVFRQMIPCNFVRLVKIRVAIINDKHSLGTIATMPSYSRIMYLACFLFFSRSLLLLSHSRPKLLLILDVEQKLVLALHSQLLVLK